jgi:hypothetical protein
MISEFRSLRACALGALLLARGIALAVPQRAAKPGSEKIQCDAHLDSKHKGWVIVVLDLTGLSPMKNVEHATIAVDFLDGNGKKVGSQKFPFVDNSEQSLPAGHKYSRPYGYSDKGFSGPVVIAKAVSADALVVTDVRAVKKKDSE